MAIIKILFILFVLAKFRVGRRKRASETPPHSGSHGDVSLQLGSPGALSAGALSAGAMSAGALSAGAMSAGALSAGRPEGATTNAEHGPDIDPVTCVSIIIIGLLDVLNYIVACQRGGSPTNHPGSGQRQDTGPGILNTT